MSTIKFTNLLTTRINIPKLKFATFCNIPCDIITKQSKGKNKTIKALFQPDHRSAKIRNDFSKRN